MIIRVDHGWRRWQNQTSDTEPAIQPSISYVWKTWQICTLVLAVSFIINITTSQVMKPIYGWVLQALIHLAESNGISTREVQGHTNDTASEIIFL